MSYIVGRGRYARETYPRARATGPTGPTGPSDVASAAQHQTANTIALTPAAQTIATVTVTPTKTGQFRIWGNAAVTNNDAVNAQVVTLTVNNTTNGDSIRRTVAASAVDEGVALLAVSDVQPVGVPVTFNLQASDPNSQLETVGGVAATWLVVEEITA